MATLVDPAFRLIYAGAHRLFGVLRKRLPPLSLQGPPGSTLLITELKNLSEPSTDQGGNSASISAATGISDLEQMLKQKTFTRSEIQRLTALLHLRTIESPSDDVDGATLPSSPSPLLRLTSGSLKKHGDEGDNFHATPVVSSRVLEEETADLAKAYMGSRPTKVASSALGLSSQALRQDSKLLNHASGLPKTPNAPVAPNSFRGLENGFLMPRSQGRSAMYSMARAPYSRGPSTFSQKGIKLDYGHGAALTPSQSAWGHEGKMALKRRSSVLEDDIGSGGLLRRIRQKANLMSQAGCMSRDKRELGCMSALQQPDDGSQKLLLMNKPEPTVSKEVEENGDMSMRGSAYASVPAKSTQMAIAIDSASKLPAKPPQKKRAFQMSALEEVPYSSVNGDSTVPVKDNARVVTTIDSTSAEPPRKKRAFRMSAHEDSLELDDDIHVNHKPETSLVANKPLSAEVIKTPTLSETSKAPARAEVTPEVAKIPELKEAENATSPKTDVGLLCEQGVGFKLLTSPQSTTPTQTSVLPQSTSQMEKDSNALSLFGTSTEKVSPFQFSANELSEFKPNASSDPKVLDSDDQISIEDYMDEDSVPPFGQSPAAAAAAAPGFMFDSATPSPSPAAALSFQPTLQQKGVYTNATNGNATTTSTSSLFGFSSPAATSTTNNQLQQVSFFNATSESQVNTQASVAVTQAVPFQFASSTPSTASSNNNDQMAEDSMQTPSPSVPPFGQAPAAAPSFMFGSATPFQFASPTPSIASSNNNDQMAEDSMQTPSPSVPPFGQARAGAPSFMFGSVTPFQFASSTPSIASPNNNDQVAEDSMQTPSRSVPPFGQAPAGAPGFMFGSATPFQFASSTPSIASSNNNDQMAGDSMQTPSPSVPPFGQAPAGAPGFMFGSTSPAPAAALPFPFSGQPANQTPSQNPFQSSSAAGGGDKSGERIVSFKNKRRKS